MVRRLLNWLFGATPRGVRPSPARAQPAPATGDEYCQLPDGRSVNVSLALHQMEAQTIERRASRLSDAVHALTQADPTGLRGPLVLAECLIRDLAEVSPQHPLLPTSREAVAAFADRFDSALPPLRELGQVADVCPTCAAALTLRPNRKAKCPHCGAFIFCRTRPFDGAHVLLKASELAALEEDWATDYKMKQRQPRQLDPVWEERIAVARSAGPHANPAVEAAAQRVFAAIRAASQTEAPRDARDRLLSDFVDVQFREQVDIRVWQLQVQSMG